MGAHKELSSLSELPTLNEYIQIERTGPAYRVQAALTFTDYSAVRDAAIANIGLMPEEIPRNYEAAGGDPLGVHFLYSLSLSQDQHLKLIEDLRKRYNLDRSNSTIPEKANLEKLGIILKVKFCVKKRFNGPNTGMSGYTDDIEFVDNASRYGNSKALKSFVMRFKLSVCTSTYITANRRLRLNEIFNSSRVEAPVQQPDSQDLSMLSSQQAPGPALKKKRISGAALIHAPANFNDEYSIDSQMTSSQLERPVHSNQFMSQSSDSIINPTFQNSQHSQNFVTSIDMDEVLIDKVDLARLNAIADNLKVEGEKLYAVDTQIIGMVPLIPVIIKPYGRTLKATSFKLILQNSAMDQITVEIIEEKDICAFLGVKEVEELINIVEEIEDRILSLINSGDHCHRDLRVKRKWLDMPGYKYGYWTLVGTLAELTKGLI